MVRCLSRFSLNHLSRRSRAKVDQLSTLSRLFAFILHPSSFILSSCLAPDDAQPPAKGLVTFRPLLASSQLCPKFGNVSQSVVKIDPEIMSGAPCFASTRVPIQNLIDYLEGGDSIEDFLEGFPSISREQVIAFLEEAKECMLAAAAK